MMNNIKEFMTSCPFLIDSDININYLSETPVSSSVGSLPTEPIIRTYIDGGTMRQFLFSISLRQNYGQNADVNSSSIDLIEKIANWIEEQNKVGILPSLSGNRNPISLEIFKLGLIEEKTTNTANYGLQCKLVYYQE